MPSKTKKRRKRRKKTVIQRHHITYDPEWTVTVYVGEHYILSQLQWRKRFSKGFMIALKEFLRINESKAFDLSRAKQMVIADLSTVSKVKNSGSDVTDGKMFLKNGTPHCIVHGAMNKVSSHGIWRCLMCHVGCIEKSREKEKS